jgi:hypothetical protein
MIVLENRQCMGISNRAEKRQWNDDENMCVVMKVDARLC